MKPSESEKPRIWSVDWCSRTNTTPSTLVWHVVGPLQSETRFEVVHKDDYDKLKQELEAARAENEKNN